MTRSGGATARDGRCSATWRDRTRAQRHRDVGATGDIPTGRAATETGQKL